MAYLHVSREGPVRVVSLSRPKANAMNLDMLEELTEALRACESDTGARALVLGSAQPRFFSSGFDVGEVFAYDRPAMRHFFARFLDLCDALLRFPKPVIGALPGHAMAGGAFLALACDVRIMAEGKYGFALNEINFGAILPRSIRMMLIHVVGPREARRIILTGDSVDPVQARAIGLVDELTAEPNVLARALEWAAKLGSKPAAAFCYDKLALLRDLGHGEKDREDSLDAFLDHWFSPESTALRDALAASVRSAGSST